MAFLVLSEAEVSPPTTAIPTEIPKGILFEIIIAGGENAIQRQLVVRTPGQRQLVTFLLETGSWKLEAI